MSIVAQSTVNFTYDDNGNRIGRSVIVIPPPQYDGDSTLKDLNIYAAELEAKAVKAEIDNYNIKVFPNPTQGQLTVKIEGAELPAGVEIKVYNTTGELMLHKDKVQSITRIDLSLFISGTYILHLQMGKKSESFTVIKK